jgi:hypothetical protein
MVRLACSLLLLIGIPLAAGWKLNCLRHQPCQRNQSSADSGWSIVFAVNSTCPLSRQYVPEIRRIISMENGSNRRFHLLMVNDSITDALFALPNAAQVLDTKGNWSDRFMMHIVPAVMLYRGNPFHCFRPENVWYQGAIDNWAISLGKHRNRITAPYLLQALAAADSGYRTQPAYTMPVGCYTETFRQ